MTQRQFRFTLLFLLSPFVKMCEKSYKVKTEQGDYIVMKQLIIKTLKKRSKATASSLY